MRRLLTTLVPILAAVALMGQDGCTTSTDENGGGDSAQEGKSNKQGKGDKADEQSVDEQLEDIGVSEQELAEVTAEVLVQTNGKKWLRENCEAIDLAGEELALAAFKLGYDRAETGLSARKAFNAIRARC